LHFGLERKVAPGIICKETTTGVHPSCAFNSEELANSEEEDFSAVQRRMEELAA